MSFLRLILHPCLSQEVHTRASNINMAEKQPIGDDLEGSDQGSMG
jgi:hypothetical protein